ncbi:MAG: dephospho-CoA kinase [Bacteriovorax sp.]|jgi:dephospho-CoA kinase
MKNLKAKWITKTPSTRLYNIPVPIIGLTGGIGSGKSTVAELLTKNNIPVIDADKLVKNIYKLSETKTFIQKQFPQTIVDGEIVFKKLREIVFNNEAKKMDLEVYIYARLPEEFRKAYAVLNNPAFIVYDVPLLFEKKLNQLVDVSVCVYAPKEKQIERLILRDQIERPLAESILANQISIEDKKNMADLIINNTDGLSMLEAEFQKFLADISN